MSGWYWYSDNPNCGRCGHLNSQGHCNMTACIYPVLPQTQTIVMTEHRMTNAMTVRLMSNEDMAKWRANGQCPPSNYHGDYDCVNRTCDQCWLDWLQSEVTT